MTTKKWQCMRCRKPDDGEIWIDYRAGPCAKHQMVCPDCMTKGEAWKVKREIGKRRTRMRRSLNRMAMLIQSEALALEWDIEDPLDPVRDVAPQRSFRSSRRCAPT
jgi:hypothetical protein